MLTDTAVVPVAEVLIVPEIVAVPPQFVQLTILRPIADTGVVTTGDVEMVPVTVA